MKYILCVWYSNVFFLLKNNCDGTDPLNSSTGSLETESVWKNIYILIPKRRILVVDLLQIENVDPLGDCSKCRVNFILLWAASPLVEKLCTFQQEIHCTAWNLVFILIPVKTLFIQQSYSYITLFISDNPKVQSQLTEDLRWFTDVLWR